MRTTKRITPARESTKSIANKRNPLTRRDSNSSGGRKILTRQRFQLSARYPKRKNRRRTRCSRLKLRESRFKKISTQMGVEVVTESTEETPSLTVRESELIEDSPT